MKKKQVKVASAKQEKSVKKAPLISELRQTKKNLEKEIKSRMAEIKLLTKELKNIDKDIRKSRKAKGKKKVK